MGSIPAIPVDPMPESIHSIKFDSLPDKHRVWHAKPGSKEEGLGKLVLLTPEVVAKAAASCIRTGQRVSLNWDLTKLDIANFNRAPTQHHITSLLGGAGFDDVYIFNPQQSSQWDGLRHFSAPFPTPENPSQRLFYGGTTAMEISDRSNNRIGIQHWAKEGICGRGVLLDYVAYAQRNSIDYSALSDHAVPLRVLKQIAQEQGVHFQRGDILFIRIGLTKEWDNQMGPADKLAYAQSSNPQHAGVEGTEEMLRWIWDEGFAAVAGDAVSFEVYPPQKSYQGADGSEVQGLFMHEYLIAGWGLPIGELFDLEELSRKCQELGRWEFFVSSSPLNMPGGVSSPPNCLAIF
ncbi:Cornichon [Ilyonectria robusta]